MIDPRYDFLELISALEEKHNKLREAAQAVVDDAEPSVDDGLCEVSTGLIKNLAKELEKSDD